MNSKDKDDTKSRRQKALDAINSDPQKIMELANNGVLLRETTEQLFERAKLRDYRAEEIQAAIKASKQLEKDLPKIQKQIEDFREFMIYLRAEVKKPQYGGRSVDDLAADPNADDEDSLFLQAWQAAERARDEDRKAKAKEKQRERQKGFSKIHYNEVESVKLATDKLLDHFFTTAAKTNGQHVNIKLLPETMGKEGGGHSLKYEGEGRPRETLKYNYSIDEKRLQAFDVEPQFNFQDLFTIAMLDNLYRTGNTRVSLSKIWHELGGKGNPPQYRRTEIFESILKGDATTVIYNAPKVIEDWTGRPPQKGYLSMRRIISVDFDQVEYAVKNGKFQIKDDSFITIKGPSLFYEFAEQLNRITEYSSDFFKLYDGSRTKLYYNVLFYLVRQVSWMRNGGRSNKITYSDLYEATGANTGTNPRRQRAKVQKLAKDILQQMFIPAGYVTSAEEATTGAEGLELTYKKKG
jgi:hypothetical protein